MRPPNVSCSDEYVVVPPQWRKSANPSIVPLESHGLDQVHGRPQASAQPQDGADVAGDLGLEQGDTHPG